MVQAHQVFPRNDTSAPMEHFPVIFAFKGSDLPSMNRWITFDIWGLDNMTIPTPFTSYRPTLDEWYAGADFPPWHDLSTDDPHVTYKAFSSFNIEGRGSLVWQMGFITCVDEFHSSRFPDDELIRNSTSGYVHFTTSNSAPQVDLAAATDNGKNCFIPSIAVDVKKTRKYPDYDSSDRNRTCAVLASSSNIIAADSN